MNDFYDLAILLHKWSIYISLIIACTMFFVTKTANPKRRYLGFLPLYYTLLACIAFTGLVMINFITSIAPFIMALLWIYILVTTIKIYKTIKKEPKLTQASIKLIQKKYIVDILIYLVYIIYGRY